MCGIAGLWKTSIGNIDSMVRSMIPRGPDHQGIYKDEIVHLGMTRLAIQDTRHDSNQPMSNSDKSVYLVFNGEMYNFIEERKRLVNKGYSFVSQGDTEVVLALYLIYGDHFVKYIRGMFALAIYDKRKGIGEERIIFARDHFGIKPLLYTAVNGGIAFASELKALLRGGVVNLEIDSIALWQLLTHGSVQQPKTILSKVYSLPPAHMMIADKAGVKLHKYWSLGENRIPNINKLCDQEISLVVEDALRDSVARQLISDVPIGAFLSGGIDSSLLVAMASEKSSSSLRTYSVGYDKEGSSLDETYDANIVANYFGTNHSQIIVTGEDVLNSLNDISMGLDQPTVDGINSYFVSRAASVDLKVAISGTGGDELFGGYPWFLSMLEYEKRVKISSPTSLKEKLVSYSGLKFSPFFRKKNNLEFLKEFSKQYGIFGGQMAKRLMCLDHQNLLGDTNDEISNYLICDELPSASVLNRTSALVTRGYALNQLLRDIDSASMAHSLEIRVPFLDPVIADVALSLPIKSKYAPPQDNVPRDSYAGLGLKKVLVDIGRRILPKGFELRAKRGFVMPIDFWLRGPLNEIFHDTLSETNIRKHNILDYKTVSEIVSNFSAGKIHWSRPWLIFMIELWYQNTLKQPQY